MCESNLWAIGVKEIIAGVALGVMHGPRESQLTRIALIPEPLVSSGKMEENGSCLLLPPRSPMHMNGNRETGSANIVSNVPLGCKRMKNASIKNKNSHPRVSEFPSFF